MDANFFEPTHSCPVCSSTQIAFELVIHYWREYPLTFFSCSFCGAHFANPMPSNKLIGDGNDALVKWYQRDRNFSNEFHDARQAYLRGRILAGKLKRWKQRGHLLDLGCYNGFLPLGIQDYSEWKVEGLEISSELSEFISSKLGIACHKGTLEELQLPENQYDFILCHDLIEHINQPEKFLAEIVRVLKPGGRIQIITPNVYQDLAFSKRAYKSGSPVTMLLNHILYFSPRALRIALEKVGLKVKKIYCYDVKHSLKDFGCFGLGKPVQSELGPSMKEASQLQMTDNLSQWDHKKIDQLRKHKKVSALYGFLRQTLPKSLTLHVPAKMGIGHEIYVLAEKT